MSYVGLMTSSLKFKTSSGQGIQSEQLQDSNFSKHV